MKPTVYLDTTIPSYICDERDAIRDFIHVSRQWWEEQRRHYQIFTSAATIAEIESGDFPRKDETLQLLEGVELLESSPEIVGIAEFYIANFLMPRSLTGDAFHLACASFHKMDFIATWNCNHLANGNKRRHIRVLNGRLGLSTPEIVTPLELFLEDPAL